MVQETSVKVEEQVDLLEQILRNIQIDKKSQGSRLVERGDQTEKNDNSDYMSAFAK